MKRPVAWPHNTLRALCSTPCSPCLVPLSPRPPLLPSCTCFKRKDGTKDAEGNVVPAWIGPDCSLRTCPFAKAWVDIPFFNNTAHRNAECSNAGSCDRKTGNCVCYPGYEGRACDRSTCPPPPHPPSHEPARLLPPLLQLSLVFKCCHISSSVTATGNSPPLVCAAVCPNSCSGHGTCQSQSTFVRDQKDAATAAGATTLVTVYDAAWDAKKIYGCKCELGYRGPDCSLKECPSGADPQGGPDGYVAFIDTDNGGIQRREPRDCSGRGKCDYSNGNCICFKGFFGEDCSLQTALV
jgi:hypothetical protein